MEQFAKKPTTIHCKAAVAEKPGSRLQIVTIAVEPPQRGEVRVKVWHCALCHTDELALSGEDAEAVFPCILGHEACGVVESIGEDVQTCSPGDYVVLAYQAECFKEDRMSNTCNTCSGYENGLTNLCGKIRAYTGKGIMKTDSRPRFSYLDGTPIFHFMGTSSFSEFTVVHQESIAVINSTVACGTSFKYTCLLGCGVSTGLGAVWNTAKVSKNSTVAVFGLGTVGLAVIEGAKASGAKKIIAVDTNNSKFAKAESFGATDFMSPNPFCDPIEERIRTLTNGGVDFSFDCTGNVDVMRSALESCAKGWGTSIIIGVAAAGKEISTRPFQLVTGRVWKGTAFGGWKPRRDIPLLVQMYCDGKIRLEEYVTDEKELCDINDGFELLRKGECLRCLISF